MNPLGRTNLHHLGNDKVRIGDNVRNKTLNSTKVLEDLLESTCPLALTHDVKVIHPPYFSEFSYHDVLNGISLHTLSIEVNARLSEQASTMTASHAFPLGEVMDKYTLQKPKKQYRKVIFLAGSNSHNLIDQCKLQQLMADDEWVIKLHPVTNDGTIRDLASVFGYHRLIDRKESGMDLLDAADQIASLQTSELFILARLMGKAVVDITRFDRAWLCAYHSLLRNCTGDDVEDKRIITNMLMSDLSGHLRLSYGEARNRELAMNYYTAAMVIREQFKMITNQRLIVSEKTFVDWEAPKKN